MDLNTCTVCRVTSTRALTLCPLCKNPRHAGTCANRKGECDNCRYAEKQRDKEDGSKTSTPCGPMNPGRKQQIASKQEQTVPYRRSVKTAMTRLSGATLDPPPLVSTSDLPGVTHVLIPSTVLELLFRRLDLLHDAIGTSKSTGNGTQNIFSNQTNAEHAGAKYGELVNQVSASGRILGEQNSRLEDLHNKQQILLRENKALKEQLSSSNICACPNVTGINSNVGKNCDAGGSLASDKQDPNIELTSFTSNAVNSGAGSHADASEYRENCIEWVTKERV
ncbi:hypothetical protein QAD02_007336 [Eretmocerus hayati]|uniref:Uncharacterized protein n=1 Tax=Eretmocerus hayati TaxID=131215 RepID=A0ACC2N5R7_9HYME|nr:hypothetical protein QAD02_007336 [Eretmocerus hayati]